MAIKHSYNAQDRFSEELELAIDGWKQAMNTEISKAKEVADELHQLDLKNYISKVSSSKIQLFLSSLVPLP